MNLRTVTLPGGESVPALGLGTWQMGERADTAKAEIAAIRRGLDLGMTLVDTAEMYGNGGAEERVGAAVRGRRDQVFIVSKVLPSNASCKGAVAACERSLKRLGTDRIDLYLLHWRGSVPLKETVAGFDGLKHQGKIRHWGVSNFDRADMEELWAVPGGKECASNQVLYHLGERSVEFDLLPALRKRGVPAMAYSPLAQGRILGHRALKEIARKSGATAAQIALAWVLAQDDVIAIPKAADPFHLAENRAALDLALTTAELVSLDEAFPPPRKRTPLAMI
jgi:diketogulonate reductase-like aldo/keto reductase